MKTIYPKINKFSLVIYYIATVVLISCNRFEEINQDSEIEPLKQGFKVSAAVGYCASLANTLFRGEDLPDNVLFQSISNDEYSGSGLMYLLEDE